LPVPDIGKDAPSPGVEGLMIENTKLPLSTRPDTIIVPPLKTNVAPPSITTGLERLETVSVPELRATVLPVFAINRLFANAAVPFAISAVFPESTTANVCWFGTEFVDQLGESNQLPLFGPFQKPVEGVGAGVGVGVGVCPYKLDDPIEIRLKRYSQGLVDRKPTRKRGGKDTNIARIKFLDQVATSKNRRVSFLWRSYHGVIGGEPGLLVEFP
jgi:hypothetical protein